jgi:hypothetical protein
MVSIKDLDQSVEMDEMKVGKKGTGKGPWFHTGFDATGGKKGNPYEKEGAKMFQMAQEIGGKHVPKELLYKALREYIRANLPDVEETTTEEENAEVAEDEKEE